MPHGYSSSVHGITRSIHHIKAVHTYNLRYRLEPPELSEGFFFSVEKPVLQSLRITHGALPDTSPTLSTYYREFICGYEQYT